MFIVAVFFVLIALAFGGWSLYTESKAREIAARWGDKPSDLESVALIKTMRSSCDLSLPYVLDRAITIYSDQHQDQIKRYEDKKINDLFGNPIALGLTQTILCPLADGRGRTQIQSHLTADHRLQTN
jgi:hypothetical protein